MKKKLVVTSGAGMRAESGIATFRDMGGMWERHDISEVATPQAWKKNPQLVMDFYNQRRKQLLSCTPNRGHEIIAELVIGGTYEWKHTTMIIGVRGALHYQFINKLDTYGGLMLGYNIHSSSAIGDASKYGTPSSFGGFDWELFIGGRYYFTDNIGAFLELGYGVAVANVGVTFKF
ncbi:MAG: hypothetical protein LBV41_11475 [Cytophagaceae bacterium]|nr:hypothetical protein [Cytophagaceae bacterium]